MASKHLISKHLIDTEMFLEIMRLINSKHYQKKNFLI